MAALLVTRRGAAGRRSRRQPRDVGDTASRPVLQKKTTRLWFEQLPVKFIYV